MNETQMNHRHSPPKNRFVELDRLESLASEALEDYNREMTLGGEPVYPQWADDLQALIKEHRVALAHNAYLEALVNKGKERNERI